MRPLACWVERRRPNSGVGGGGGGGVSVFTPAAGTSNIPAAIDAHNPSLIRINSWIISSVVDDETVVPVLLLLMMMMMVMIMRPA